MLDIKPGAFGSNPAEFTASGTRLYFSANGAEGQELWKKTIGGAVLVEDILAWHGRIAAARPHRRRRNALLRRFHPASGGELWRSQGFAADTELVAEIGPGSASGSPSSIRDSGPFGGGILFAAETAAAGQELFTSTGASGNFQLVSNFAAGTASSFPEIQLVNGFVAFVSAHTNATGREPWMSVDVGVTYTEVALGDLYPGNNDSDPSDFVVAGGTTFFVAEDPTHGRELWKTGGSAATTVLVEDIFPGAASSGIRAPVAFDGKLFFGACEPATGCELWTSDGTSGGTQLFKDLLPGIRSGDPRFLKVVGDDLYFRACDEATGCELWVTDGTPQRTRRAADLRPGGRSSKPGGDGSQDAGSRLVASGDYLFFAADDGSGDELHAIALFLFDDGFESNDTSAWSLTVD